jgi:hypothetical protein
MVLIAEEAILLALWLVGARIRCCQSRLVGTCLDWAGLESGVSENI